MTATQLHGATLADASVPNSKLLTPPASGSGSMLVLAADISDSSSNVPADTGLEFSALAGVLYRFEVQGFFTTAATTTGARFVVDGPALTDLAARSLWSVSSSALSINPAVNAYNTPASAATSAASGNNYLEVRGFIKVSAAGVVKIRFCSEVSGSAVTIKAGSSIEWRAMA